LKYGQGVQNTLKRMFHIKI